MPTPTHTPSTAAFGFLDEPNDALAVLYGLTLALTAPDDTRAAKAADLVCSIYDKSQLTEQDLESLKSAAVVLVNCDTEAAS
tara:strand:+ start:968 stop:1213 length:246 start_codon:yes stop_codon:yes gene_type:complete